MWNRLYDSILRELKKGVNPDELGATVQGIKETRWKDLLMELKCSEKDRGRLDTAFKEALGASEAVRHLIPRIEVEVTDLESRIEAADVKEAVRGFFKLSLPWLWPHRSGLSWARPQQELLEM